MAALDGSHEGEETVELPLQRLTNFTFGVEHMDGTDVRPSGTAVHCKLRPPESRPKDHIMVVITSNCPHARSRSVSAFLPSAETFPIPARFVTGPG